MATQDSGKMGRRREKALISIRMERSMKEIGIKIKNMVMEPISIKMGMCIREDGGTITGMGME